ncbi:MAG: hypothetical protein ACXWFS_00700, partial [Thermoanaerobaculia bacterium]
MAGCYCSSLGLLLRALALIGLARANRRNALGNRHLEALGRPRRVIELGNRDARQALADRALDLSEIRLLVGRDEREGVTRQLGARRAADAV